jgi:hypothetical protein
MADGLRVIGAGLPRTGTYSLRSALEQLLGSGCYHMSMLRERGDVDVPAFTAAARGEPVSWEPVFAGCRAAVDWPASAVWQQIAQAHPDALVLLSSRADADAWWRSADKTVWAEMRRLAAATDLDERDTAWFAMAEAFMLATFGPGWQEPDVAKAGYLRWNDGVRRQVPAERLVDWRPGDGWEPLCAALDLPVPAEPFPHRNTTEEFLLRRDAALAARRDNQP